MSLTGAGAAVAAVCAALVWRRAAWSCKEIVHLTFTPAELKIRWEKLIQRLAATGHLVLESQAAVWWTEIERRHSEVQRHYHDLTHLAELMGYVDSSFGEEIRSCPASQNLVELSVFFHDIIYDPTRPDNEERSADLFKAFANKVTLSHTVTEAVYQWIVATKSHKLPAGAGMACALFLDFDMAILSKTWPQYLRYARQIRREYAHVPKDTYCRLRSEFLSAFADSQIYASKTFAAAATARARRNLRREVRILSLNAGLGILEE